MMLNPLTVTASISLLSAFALALPTQANSTTHADHLLPLEPRQVTVQVDQNLFKSVTQESNSYRLEQPDSDALTELLGTDVLNDLVDENGDVDLPLGITVFDAMGTTSIGFGGDF